MGTDGGAEASGRPDREAALARYRAHAGSYDTRTDFALGDRRRVVGLLGARPGDVVVDVGCGTGLCFAELIARIGPGGRLVGIEQSNDMLEQAGRRVAAAGWHNVELVLGPAEDVDIPVVADGALFCFTHDVLRTPAAVANVVGHLRPGARVAAVGPMWAPWWAPAMNLLIWSATRPYVTTFEGFAEPWSHLARAVPGLEVERIALAGKFFAWGALA